MRSISKLRRTLASTTQQLAAAPATSSYLVPQVQPPIPIVLPSPKHSSRPRLPNIISPALYIQPTVDLTYERFGPESSSRQDTAAVVIIPGLFSSAELWRTLAKPIALRLETPVYALNLRNHGTSPHIDHLSHSSMAADVLAFCKKHNLKKICLLGHSQGAKVAMTLALRPDLPPGLLSNVVIGDTAPVDRPLDPDVQIFLRAMADVESRDLSTREEAIEVIKQYTQVKAEIKFILTNLVLRTPGNPADPAVPLRFRIPLETMKKHVPGLQFFPYKPSETAWQGRILFLQGFKSDYLTPRTISLTQQLFPNMELKMLEGGHWLPFENSKDFITSVCTFLRA